MTTESGISYLKFWLEISDVQSVVFSVRAGDEARIALSETSTTPGLYTTRQLLLKSRTQLIDFDDGANIILVRKKIKVPCSSALTESLLFLVCSVKSVAELCASRLVWLSCTGL